MSEFGIVTSVLLLAQPALGLTGRLLLPPPPPLPALVPPAPVPPAPPPPVVDAPAVEVPAELEPAAPPAPLPPPPEPGEPAPALAPPDVEVEPPEPDEAAAPASSLVEQATAPKTARTKSEPKRICVILPALVSGCPLPIADQSDASTGSLGAGPPVGLRRTLTHKPL
jgi:hypothetical protein